MSIQRALISVSDKTGILELAQVLVSKNIEILSTGGTAKLLAEKGIPVIEVSDYTGFPEMMAGRVKTLNPKIHGGILARRGLDEEVMTQNDINPIDLVVVNLYPFQATIANPDCTLEDAIENIDIGGPTMLRAAAKNYKWVTTLTNSADYSAFIDELDQNDGCTTEELRFALMRQTFNHTADYDSAIAVAMDNEAGIHSKRFSYTNGKKLRYGENSHQEALIYEDKTCKGSLATLECLHGKEISYNNVLDIEAAIMAVNDVIGQAVSVVKHLNSCGFACGHDQRQVFENAWSGDPVSAFGSIIAFNQKLTLETAEFLHLNDPDKSQRKFIEVIIAPAYEDAAFEYLCFHKNLRVVRYDSAQLERTQDYRFVYGSLLQQTPDNILLKKMEQVTLIDQAIELDKELVEFGLRAVRNIKSNAIVLVQRRKSGICRLLGMGTGQPNRLISTKLAIEKARENLQLEAANLQIDDFEAYYKKIISQCIMVSDAFFPFADNIEIAAEKGVRTIVQPGGSMRDKSVKRKAEELGVKMIFTGLRHFKH